MRKFSRRQRTWARRVRVATAVLLAAAALASPVQALAAATPIPSESVVAPEDSVDGFAGPGWLVGWTLSNESSAAVAQDELVFAQDAAQGPFETCGLSFRRRIHQASQFDYQASWGARFNCNVSMRYMKFRARLVRYQHDSDVLAYGNLINKADARNEFSGGNNQFLHRPHLVVYVSADLGFPVPPDPNNYAIGVAADPSSVNQNQSNCHRVGETYVVHCEARSISFE